MSESTIWTSWGGRKQHASETGEPVYAVYRARPQDRHTSSGLGGRWSVVAAVLVVAAIGVIVAFVVL